MLYMFFVEGFEETEAIATIDVIRRSGLKINTVSEDGEVTGSHDITIKTDLCYRNISKEGLKGIVLPGGPGTSKYMDNKIVLDFIDYASKENLLLSAICAAPTIFSKLNLLNGKNAVCFPSCEEELVGAIVSKELVVCDKNFITAKAMGVSMEFGLAIVSYFLGEKKATQVKESIFLG